jgi:hypothetical protein
MLWRLGEIVKWLRRTDKCEDTERFVSLPARQVGTILALRQGGQGRVLETPASARLTGRVTGVELRNPGEHA